MSNELTARLQSLAPGFTIMNTSDHVQEVAFNSVVYRFEPGEKKQIKGQIGVQRDMYGRPTEDAMTSNGGLHKTVKFAPDPNATADIIAQHMISNGRSKGLILIRGDETDKTEIKAGRAAWLKTAVASAKAMDSRWRQRVLADKAAGNPIPVMPVEVEEAQDFIIKYKGGDQEQSRRFVVTIDGRSFDTKVECEKHIRARYPNEMAAWETFVNDTTGDEPVVETEVEAVVAEPEDDPEAVAMLNEKKSRGKK